jgi:hypothetical protein
MEFALGFHLSISVFDNLDFFQFEWKFDRVQKHIKEENDRKTQKTNIADGSRF